MKKFNNMLRTYNKTQIIKVVMNPNKMNNTRENCRKQKN